MDAGEREHEEYEAYFRDLSHDKRLVNAVYGLDDLTAVVVAQTYIEYCLLEYVRRGVPDADALGKKAAGMQFRHLLALSIALGRVDGALKKPLGLIAEVRNAFAHQIAHEVTEADVDSIYAALPPFAVPHADMNGGQRVDEALRFAGFAEEEIAKVPNHAKRLRGILLALAFELVQGLRGSPQRS